MFPYRRVHYGNKFNSLSKERKIDVIIISSLLREHKDYRNVSIEEQEKIEYSIESSCHEEKNKYNVSISLIKGMLSNEKCRNILVPKLLSGEILPNNLLKLKLSDITNSHIKVYEEFNNRQNAQLVQKSSSLYKCKKCGLRNTVLREEQRRCQDECATIIITCLTDGCGYEWKN